MLHAILAALIGSMILCEVFHTYIWHEYEDWNIAMIVPLTLSLGIGWFVMIWGNFHGANPLEMIVGLLITAGITTCGVLAPWKAFYSYIEEDILIIAIICVGSLAFLLQIVVLVARLRGSRRSVADDYLDASLDYTAWIIKGRPVVHSKSCSCLGRRKRRKRGKRKDDEDWSRSTFGKRRLSKCNPFRCILTNGIHFVPATFTLAFVMGTVFVLVLSLKLHFFFLERRDWWIENHTNRSSHHVDEIRDVVLGAFNSRSRRFLFGKNLTTSYDVSTISSSLVNVDLLLSWIVPTANATLLAVVANLTSQIESSQILLNNTRNALSSLSLTNTTTLNGTSVTDMLSLVEYVDVSNALSHVTNNNNVSEIRHRIVSATSTFHASDGNLTLVSNFLSETSNVETLASSLYEVESGDQQNTWFEDTVQDFYDACMIGNLVAVIWCCYVSLGMLSHWKRAWRKVRRGKFGRAHCYKASWSNAFTFVGYRIGVLFWSFWLLLVVVFASYWRPLRNLWAYLFSFEDTYVVFESAPYHSFSYHQRAIPNASTLGTQVLSVRSRSSKYM